LWQTSSLAEYQLSRLAAVVCAGDALKARTNNDPVLAFAETDVTDENQVNDALDLAESAFGEPVNVSVNCAGIAVAKKDVVQKKRFLGNTLSFATRLFKDASNQHSWII
jgi:NAD(P)-dependent dehydrogenase (short-subunit alcohol dehydrogenase family)